MTRYIAAPMILVLTVVLVVGGCASLDYSSRDISQGGPPTEQEQARLSDARAARNRGDHSDALSQLQDLIADNPTITDAYLEMGAIYIETEQYTRAEPAFSRAARLEPRNFDAQYGHGLALQLLNRFVEAVRAYQRALTIEPDSSKANLNIATTYLQMEEADRAVAFAEKAVAVEPSNGAAHANLGAIYERLGRHEEAVDSYIAALELMGNRPPLMLNLVNVQAKLSRYQEAANTAKTLVRIDASAAAYERLGWCAFKLRDYTGSEDAYRQAVSLDETHWPAWNGLAVTSLNRWLLSKKRDRVAQREARDAFRKSLRANPDQPRVVQLMSDYSL